LLAECNSVQCKVSSVFLLPRPLVRKALLVAFKTIILWRPFHPSLKDAGILRTRSRSLCEPVPERLARVPQDWRVVARA
jgi:hypothetical protein